MGSALSKKEKQTLVVASVALASAALLAFAL